MCSPSNVDKTEVTERLGSGKLNTLERVWQVGTVAGCRTVATSLKGRSFKPQTLVCCKGCFEVKSI